MTLLTIDPGKEHFGYAVFRAGRLVQCATKKHSSNAGLIDVAIDLVADMRDFYPLDPFVLVMEKPENYTGNNKKKSLEGLFALCDAVNEAVGVDTFYKPKQWKAQVPKAPHHKRLLRVLYPSERLLWDEVDHNARDAIGIGLFHLGRTMIGGLLPNVG